MWILPDAILPSVDMFFDNFSDVAGTPITAHVPTPGPGVAYSAVTPGMTIQDVQGATGSGLAPNDAFQRSPVMPSNHQALATFNFTFNTFVGDTVAGLAINANAAETHGMLFQVFGDGTTRLTINYPIGTVSDMGTWSPDTAPHTLQISYDGSRVLCYLDGAIVFNKAWLFGVPPGVAYRGAYFILGSGVGGTFVSSIGFHVGSFPQ